MAIIQKNNEMDRSQKKSQRLTLLRDSAITAVIWVSLGLFSIIFFRIYGNFVQDDAYITFRYARNLTLGYGFVYNIGEWVLGTTTPLYTLLLAAIAWITKQDVALISQWLCFLSLWFSSAILYKIAEGYNKGLALSVALLYLTNPFLPHFDGMESYFLLFLFLWSVFAYNQKRLLEASIIAGLLVLVRYEMIFLMILVGGVDFIKTRKLPFWLLPGIIPVLIWVLYAFQAFGSPIPLSASVKLSAPRISFPVGLVFLWSNFIRENIFNIFALIFFFFGAWKLIRTREVCQNYSLILLFTLDYFCIASLIAGSFPWYYAPLIPGISILAVVGLSDISRLFAQTRLFTHDMKPFKIQTLLPYMLASLLIAGQLLSWYSGYRLHQGKNFDPRFVPYQQVSEWLNENASRSETIATSEIGFIGYFTDMKIIDLYGLVTPELFPWVDSPEESLRQSIQLLYPDFILLSSTRPAEIIYLSSNSHYQMKKEFHSQYFLYQKTQP